MNLPSVFRIAALSAAACMALSAQAQTPANNFIVSENDATSFVSTVTFFTIPADGTPVRAGSLKTNGSGIGGGSFAVQRIAFVRIPQDVCIFSSNAGSGDIAGIDAMKVQLTGNFMGSSTDSGASNGIGLAANSNYLYASYSTSSTIGTFQVQPGCKLTFVGDLFTAGLNSGWVTGMAIRGNMMVVTYGDGSIESFNIAGGQPVSNGDVQISTGFAEDHAPNGVDITSDGHYAIFGDASTVATIEVSDLSSGKLAATVPYNIGVGWNSGNVFLSPDETTIFVSNDSSGQVTAAFFDKATGKVTPGCTSAILKNFYSTWSYTGNIGLQLPTGAGGLLYIPEFGSNGKSSLAIVQFTKSGSSCTLTESAGSPVVDNTDASALLSIGVFPPRPF